MGGERESIRDDNKLAHTNHTSLHIKSFSIGIQFHTKASRIDANKHAHIGQQSVMESFLVGGERESRTDANKLIET